jgi:lambda family phage portal protein
MTPSAVTLYGPDGQALLPSRARALALAGGDDRAPYDAAGIYNEHLSGWRPYLWSADGELNVYRDRIVSRARDLARNDGWASGAVTRLLDNAIGPNFRPVPKPDYRALAQYSGVAAFDATWADEFGKAVAANWRTWANDPGRWCDAQRALTMPQIFALGFRHKIVDGDALAILYWRPERVGIGRARYATAVKVLDPDRLSNPQLRFDTMTMRGGVEIDADGAAVGYWIRRAHQGDWYSAAASLTWDRVPRETDWGRPVVVHDFDHPRADTHRGGAGVLTPVVERLKMLAKYDAVELDSAIVNAIFAAYVESPFDPSLMVEALGGDQINRYQNDRKKFHDERRMALGGVRLPILFPGEKINPVAATRPTSNFEAFEAAVLRNFAAGTGLSAQQVSNNWADVNYSSARGALLEAWKTIHRRRLDFAGGYCHPIYVAQLEEQMEFDALPLPAGAPPFEECRTAYARVRWLGPGRGWIDPVAEKQGAVLGMDAGLSTLEDEVAENVGADWEEVLDQRKLEVQAFKDRGLEVPRWASMQSKAGPGPSAAPATPPKPQAV